jgi:hypothetical protein
MWPLIGPSLYSIFLLRQSIWAVVRRQCCGFPALHQHVYPVHFTGTPHQLPGTGLTQ